MIYSKNLRVFATASAFALAFHVGFSSALCAMDTVDADGAAGHTTPRKAAKSKDALLLSPVPKKDAIETHPVFGAQRQMIESLRTEADQLHELSEALTTELNETTQRALALRSKKLELEELKRKLEAELASTTEQLQKTNSEGETLRASLASSQEETRVAVAKHEEHVRALQAARAAKLEKQQKEDEKDNLAARALAESLTKDRVAREQQFKLRMEALRLKRKGLPSSPSANGVAVSHDD